MDSGLPRELFLGEMVVSAMVLTNWNHCSCSRCSYCSYAHCISESIAADGIYSALSVGLTGIRSGKRFSDITGCQC